MSFTDNQCKKKKSCWFISVFTCIVCKKNVQMDYIDYLEIYSICLGPRSKLHIHSAPILHPFCMAIIVGLAMRTVVEWANYSPNKRRIVNPAEALIIHSDAGQAHSQMSASLMKSWLPHAGTVLQYKDNYQLVKRRMAWEWCLCWR